MSQLTIEKVRNKKDLCKFIRFNWELYRNNPCAVPDLLEDTLDTFDPKKNAAFDFCDVEWFMAYKGDKLVGKCVAIINKHANERWGTSNVRFGWLDFIDDEEVSQALMDAVAEWGKERGMTHIVGPLGFTDMDPEGMLFDGYDIMGNMSTIYNYPYYNDHMEKMGFEVDATWVERRIKVPETNANDRFEKFSRVAKLSSERYGFRLRKFSSKRELLKSNYIHKIFYIINESYKDLYGYSEMSDRQVDKLARTYLQYLDLRLLFVIENKEGEPIGVGICMGCMSEAIRKAKARMFPFGWWHLVKGLYFNHSKCLELLLFGILPHYQNTGCLGLIFADAIQTAQDMGFEYADCMPQLETNIKGQAIWKAFDYEITKKRHVWKKKI